MGSADMMEEGHGELRHGDEETWGYGGVQTRWTRNMEKLTWWRSENRTETWWRIVMGALSEWRMVMGSADLVEDCHRNAVKVEDGHGECSLGGGVAWERCQS